MDSPRQIECMRHQKTQKHVGIMSVEFRPSRSFADQVDEEDAEHDELEPEQEDEPEVHSIGDLLLILDCTRRNATAQLSKFGDRSEFVCGRSAEILQQRVVSGGGPVELWTASNSAQFESVRVRHGVQRPPASHPNKVTRRQKDAVSSLYI